MLELSGGLVFDGERVGNMGEYGEVLEWGRFVEVA